MSLLLAALTLIAPQAAAKCVITEPALVEISGCSGKPGDRITLTYAAESRTRFETIEFFVFAGGKMVKHNVRPEGSGLQQTVQIPAALCELPSQRWTMRMLTSDERPFHQATNFETRCTK